MKDQNSQVLPDENILRRIPNNNDWVKQELDLPIQRLAFQPQKRDTDGLSVFREQFVSPQDLAKAGPNSSGYYIARIKVANIIELGLTVVADPQENQPPGHALIPELNWDSYRSKSSRQKSREFQLELAKLACLDIVYVPE